MIIYHPAFDLYHTVYRILKLLTNFKRGDFIEIDRVRIWDFYLLFPDKIHSIKLKKDEKDIKDLINSFIKKRSNPYEILLDDRKMFEKIKPYQITALKCLASYGVIDKSYLKENKVTIVSKVVVENYSLKLEPLSIQEQNLINLLTSHFYLMSLFGENGLKERTKLLESKYDA